jgi:hypothetical protein
MVKIQLWLQPSFNNQQFNRYVAKSCNLKELL